MDLGQIENYFHKIAAKKKIIMAVVRIQAAFRGFKARRYFKKYYTNKIRLAVNVQRVWKRHYSRILKRRKEENEFLQKVIKIQAFLRGSKTRKNFKSSLIKKFKTVQHFFDRMKNKIENESAAIIQRNWRKTIVKIRRLRTLRHVLWQQKMVRIIEKWGRLSKGSKRGRRKSKHIGFRNPVLKEEKTKPNVSNAQMSKSK